jgi:hypothetical protein
MDDDVDPLHALSVWERDYATNVVAVEERGLFAGDGIGGCDGIEIVERRDVVGT